MMVRKNSITTVATTRGVTSFFVGISAQSAHGIDLLGHGHRAQFAGHSGRVAAGDHQPGDDRPQFSDHADRNQLGDKSEGTEARQRAGAVQGQHGAGEAAGQDHDRQGTDADQVGLLNHVGDVQGPPEKIGQRLAREQGVVLQRLDLLLGEFSGRYERDLEIPSCHAVWPLSEEL